MKSLRVAIFTRPDVPQFLIPGMWEDPDGNTSCGLTVDAMMIAIAINAKHEWYEIKVDENGIAQIPHKKAELIGPQFAHGGITILVPTRPILRPLGVLDRSQHSREV